MAARNERNHFVARPLPERLERGTQRTEHCWLWTGAKDKNGYGVIVTYKHSRPARYYKAHRLAWELANGPIPDGLWVLHHCDNPPCVRVEHLYLGTGMDNSRDTIQRGRFVLGQRHHGEAHYHAKLTESQVREIRTLCANGEMTQAAVARRFGVNWRTVHLIHHRKAWRHLE
jgi:hypothetical protein